jgi:hypothetical protein
MIYAQLQEEHGIIELQEELRVAKDAKWYRRLKIIQLSINGISVKKLSDIFSLCPKTVRKYIKAPTPNVASAKGD